MKLFAAVAGCAVVVVVVQAAAANAVMIQNSGSVDGRRWVCSAGSCIATRQKLEEGNGGWLQHTQIIKALGKRCRQCRRNVSREKKCEAQSDNGQWIGQTAIDPATDHQHSSSSHLLLGLGATNKGTTTRGRFYLLDSIGWRSAAPAVIAALVWSAPVSDFAGLPAFECPPGCHSGRYSLARYSAGTVRG